uniref:G-protein coupled receptors family 1 profile domain-containing protein n=1 Tax=Amphimedon queenslandica TaxID=400682 RepID=A0A1X7SN30_AMPQE
MNNSTELPESFGAIHSALHVSIFAVIGIPLFTISFTFIVALLTAKDVNWKMRVVLINILIPNIIYSLTALLYNLGYPVRVYLIEGNNDDAAITASCFLPIPFYGIANLGNAFGGLLFFVLVYIFAKYGLKKLKWIGIVSYIATIWVLILLFRLISILLNLNYLKAITSIGGFCIFPVDQTFIASFIVDALLIILNITFVVIFSTCNFFL